MADNEVFCVDLSVAVASDLGEECDTTRSEIWSGNSHSYLFELCPWTPQSTRAVEIAAGRQNQSRSNSKGLEIVVENNDDDLIFLFPKLNHKLNTGVYR